MDEPLSNLDAKPRADTRRAGRAAAPPGGDGRVRHARPGRGHDHGAPHRRDGAGRAAAGRPAAGRVRASRQPVRGPVHRQPADEHGCRHGHRARRRPRGGGAGWAGPAAAPLAAVREAGVRDVVLGVRPEDLQLTGDADGISAAVVAVESLGHERHVACRLPDGQLVILRGGARPGTGAGRDGASGGVGHGAAPVRRRCTGCEDRVTATAEPAVTGGVDASRRRAPAVVAAPGEGERARGAAAGDVARDLRRLHLLSADPQRVPGLLPEPAVPRAQAVRRLRPVPRRAHVGGVPREPAHDGRLRCSPCPRGSRSDSRRGARAPAAA